MEMVQKYLLFYRIQKEPFILVGRTVKIIRFFLKKIRVLDGGGYINLKEMMELTVIT